MPWTVATTRVTDFFVTAPIWNAEHVDNMNFLREVNYTPFTGDVSVTQTTVGTAQQIVTSGAITYEAVPHMVYFYCPFVNSGAVQLRLIVRDGTTVLGTFARINASMVPGPIGELGFRVTPSAGSHSYNVAGWLSGAGTWTMEAGTGGAAGDATTDVAGYMRIARIPI